MKDRVQPPIQQNAWEKTSASGSGKPIQAKANDTGLPDNLKTGVENLSGYSLDDVKVHYNSPKPASLQAHAYAQGTDIHVAPGQERHLPHEAWHVVQQKQGRVKPTRQLKGIGLNDEGGLEAEADQMGNKAFSSALDTSLPVQAKGIVQPVVQREMISKDAIFIEQVKMQAARGFAMLADKAAKDEDCENFARALRTKGLVLPTFKFTGKSQKDFLAKQKNSGLAGITLKALQDNGLIMEAVKLAEMKSSWMEYRTETDEDGPDEEGMAEGLGGRAQSDNKDLKTRIKWKPVDGNSGEGKGVTALVLAPDHPLGSTPSGDAKEQSQTLTEDTQRPYIAGHLLNDHLGGLGNDQRNITALPKDVNTEQSDKIEETVKKIVNVDHKIAFYQVDVVYAKDGKGVGDNKTKHHYARTLTSTFGVYKEGTDFSKLAFGAVPDSELNEKYVHVLPIQAPSVYAKDGEGYKLNHLGYVGGGSRDPARTIGLGGNVARMKVNMGDVLLKDDKQIKLEFLSAAISSLQIRELNDKISTLEQQAKEHSKELGDKTEELKKLKEELGEKDKALGELKLKILEVEDLAKKEAQQKIQLEGENESLKKDNKEMALLIQQVKEQLDASDRELKETKEKLLSAENELSKTKLELENTKIDLGNTKDDSRFRMEQLGSFVAKVDENPNEYLKTFKRGPSPESHRRFMQGFGNYSGPKYVEQKPPINMEDIQKGSEDGLREGEKEGENTGYRHGWNKQNQELDPFVFKMGSESYQKAYTQAYKLAYGRAYQIAYSRAQNDYRIQRKLGYEDGRAGKQARNNNDAYWAGYENGAYDLGYSDGNNGRNTYTNYMPYMKGYNWGMYDWGDYDGRLDLDKNNNKNYRSNNNHYREGYDKAYTVKRVKKEQIQ